MTLTQRVGPVTGPERVLDLLETEGGWCSLWEIAHRLGVRLDTVGQIVRRLERDGRVVRRKVPIGACPDRVDVKATG